jgi:hypothetical protein
MIGPLLHKKMKRNLTKLPVRFSISIPEMFFAAVFGSGPIELSDSTLDQIFADWKIKTYSRGSKGIVTKLSLKCFGDTTKIQLYYEVRNGYGVKQWPY